ncbi:S41 family peptidase [Pedobacter miscanthi]|uniref:Tail specific protease domain-containing protein n=1 Tax=Pedobacter miscanthi TaxID=2259170 RepID=A0A366KS97_9SPHI|nr:S41 family peptidase [Pedobacter miscanthi]RBQ04511.1 hypothetical protein DRW42_17920 [Pedobacter miscanthi]
MANLLKLKYILYTLVLIVAFNRVNAQAINETDKCFLFFKTWNFLKYYHPQFAGGKKDADSFFLNKQFLLNKVSNRIELNALLAGMIDDLDGSTAGDLKNADFKTLENNLLHKWYLKNDLINGTLKKRLLSSYLQRDTLGQHYVPAKNYDSEIPNERVYKYPDSTNLPPEMRLLTLAKLQGVIDYLYPHKSLMNENWDQTVKNNILLFKKCNSRMDYEILLLKIVAKLNDSHAYNRFYNTLIYKKEIFKNSYYPPFAYKILDDKILVTKVIVPTLCTEAGIKVGNLITAINKQSVTKRINGLGELLSASNRNTLVFKLNDYVTNFIWAGDSAHFQLEISSSGKKKLINALFVTPENKAERKTISNYLITKAKVEATNEPFRILNNKIAYFNIDSIHELLNGINEDRVDARMDSIFNLAAQQKGIIFDMRGYPHWGGFVFHYIYKKFAKQHNIFAQYFQADVKNLGHFSSIPGTFTYYPDGEITDHYSYKGKVYIIVNAQTHSLSEWNTMNLQFVFPNAITIGEQTSGADGDEKSINIPGNYSIHFTGNAIYYPDGTLAQGKGVKINQTVKSKISDILTGADTQLIFAVNAIK